MGLDVLFTHLFGHLHLMMPYLQTFDFLSEVIFAVNQLDAISYVIAYAEW